MPFVSFEEATQQFNKQTAQKNQVGFFGLKDGEEAIVRFMYKDRNDFLNSIIKSHEIPLNGNTRRIFCTKKHAFDTTCPICNSALSFQDRWGNDKKVNQLSTKVYLNIVQYDTEGSGVVPHAKVWERNTQILNDLGEFIDNYGPLEDTLYKIKRIGSNKETKYSILPILQPVFVNNPAYAKNTKLFENYSALGTIVLNKNAEEFAEYEKTGEFPKAKPAKDDVPEIPSAEDFTASAHTTQQPSAPQPTATPVQQPMWNEAPQQNNWTERAPWEMPNNQPQQVEKPTRYF